MVLIISSCSTSRHLKDGQLLLTKNDIRLQKDRQKIDMDEVRGYIRQTPNKKLFGLFRFKLWAYQKGMRGKDTKFNRWLKNTVGEKPVIYDSILARESARDIQFYIQNLGYFNAQVTYDSKIRKKKNKAAAVYTIKPRTPYTIQKIDHAIPDARLASFVYSDTAYSLINEGDRYNAFTMDDERTRITTYLNNHGYYKFTTDYIFYEVDSTAGDHAVDMTLNIENVTIPDLDNPGKFIKTGHPRYFINNVYINPQYGAFKSRNVAYDTIIEEIHQISPGRPANYYYILHKGPLKINPRTITQSVFIENNDAFNLEDVQQTYRKFANLNIFDYTSIQFSELEKDTLWTNDRRKLDCRIRLSRAPLMAYSIEAEGTNKGGDLGLGGILTYYNRNIFRGGETFRLRLNGAIEAQGVSSSSGEDDAKFLFFNTYEYGVNASITFPRFLIPISQERFPKYFKPVTTVNTGINYQNRPNYRRYIANLSFTYDWNESETKRHILTLADLNLVKVFPTPEFKKELAEVQNERLRDQYTDHLISATRYSFVFNNQDLRKMNNFIFFRGNLESSGNILNLANNVLATPKDPEGYHTLFNIRYTQYVRTDIDFRYYFMLQPEYSLVFRTLLGLGIPYGNTDVLPFEKGFYLGGANGMRGWRFRSLGPGGYSSPDDELDRSGDLQIEANLEYRFPIYKFFKAALFLDAGNIWLLNPNKTYPDGEFRSNKFLSQMAMDAGIGFRFDFNFFVFRMDPAVKLRNPAMPAGERWTADRLQIADIIWNFGIGYPF